jgi:3-oxoacyl-[acyl-carrier protein] reductase
MDSAYVPKIAVVTGSSSGIGKATAWELAQAGYWLVLHAGRNLSGLQQVAREILQSVPDQRQRVLCLLGDIACPQTCSDLVASAFAWQGHVDAWINNAGADVLTGPAAQWSFETRLTKLWEVDVCGTIRLCRLVVERLQRTNAQISDRQQPGTYLPAIVNTSWDQAALGMEGEPGQLFGTTKAAIAAFSQALALSVSGIRVNCVAPGWIQTQWGKTAASDYWSQRAIHESSLNRWGKPEDVAQAIAWLVSDASQFVNGQTICVNGGRRYYPARVSRT